MTSRRAGRQPNAGESDPREISHKLNFVAAVCVCVGGHDAQVGVEDGVVVVAGSGGAEQDILCVLVIRPRSPLLSRKPATEIRLCR